MGSRFLFTYRWRGITKSPLIKGGAPSGLKQLQVCPWFALIWLVRVAAHGLKTLVFMIINFIISLIYNSVCIVNELYCAARIRARNNSSLNLILLTRLMLTSIREFLWWRHNPRAHNDSQGWRGGGWTQRDWEAGSDDLVVVSNVRWTSKQTCKNYRKIQKKERKKERKKEIAEWANSLKYFLLILFILTCTPGLPV